MADLLGVTRREFLGVAGAAGLALPQWYADECLAAQQAPVAEGASEALRFGLIGCGGQGTTDAKNALRFGRIVAMCDVDEQQLAKARKVFPGAETHADFRKLLERKDVDAVICGTVDHWHTIVSVAAMNAGKDVYCEKPLTLTVAEGRHLIEAQRRNNRILQTGTQQRSSVHFRLAVDLVRNGRIGKLQRAEVWLPAGLRKGPFTTSPVPKGFDYDFWLGQTPKVDYVKERTHFSFRYWWDYSGGTMTDWGAHHNDIVLWTLRMDDSGPVSVEGKPLIDMIPGGFTATSEYELKYTYANGVEHFCRTTTASDVGRVGEGPQRAAARHQVRRDRRVDLGDARHHPGQRSAVVDRQAARERTARVPQQRSHAELRGLREVAQGPDLPGRSRAPVRQPLPPGGDRHPPGAQAELGPGGRAVRRRRRGRRLPRARDAQALRPHDDLTDGGAPPTPSGTWSTSPSTSTT